MFGPCEWKNYYQELPIYEATFVRRGDMVYDYVPWTCNFYDKSPLDPIDADDTDINLVIDNPDGREV